jgi:hypothetical protein
MGFFATDPDQPGTFAAPIDPSLFGNPDLTTSLPFGIPSLNSVRGSPAAALLARAVSPYVNAYEDFAVAPLRAALTAAANSPIGDPGFWMTVQGLGAPGAFAAGAGGLTAKGLHAILGDLTVAQTASQIHNALTHPAALNGRSVSVLTTDGPTYVGSGVRDIDPIQRIRLKPYEKEARLPGEHSEPTVLKNAEKDGRRPDTLGSSRPICPLCQQFIESRGGRLTDPRTATFSPPEDLPGDLPNTDEP